MSERKKRINELLVELATATDEGDFDKMMKIRAEVDELHQEYWTDVRNAKKDMKEKKDNKTFNAKKMAEDLDIDLADVAAV